MNWSCGNKSWWVLEMHSKYCACRTLHANGGLIQPFFPSLRLCRQTSIPTKISSASCMKRPARSRTAFHSPAFLSCRLAMPNCSRHARYAVSGFALSGNFWYFTGWCCCGPGTKSAVGQMYQLWFCVTCSKKKGESFRMQHSERVHVCVCVGVCVCSRQGRKLGVC